MPRSAFRPSKLTFGEAAMARSDNRLEVAAINGVRPPGRAEPPVGTVIPRRGRTVTGRIPPEIENLTALKELFLHNNRFTGPTGRGIADDLAALPETERLTALERKKVNDNRLEGPIR